MRAVCTALCIWALALIAPASHGAVVTSGDVDLLATPPTSVLGGALEDDFLTRVFFESSVSLATPITGDVAFLGSIAAGTTVDSFFFHFDPALESSVQSSQGTATFDGSILAIFTQSASLNDSDPVFGAAGTSYPSANASRGLELGGATLDGIALLAANSLFIDFNATTGVDQIRVLVGVTSVPEPGTLALIGIGLAGFGLRLGRGRWCRLF